MPTVVWKVNGSTLAELGFANGVLSLVNLGADTLVLTQPLASGDATSSPLAWDEELVLTREEDGAPAIWFIGKVRDIDESVDRQRTITARGGWDLLERKPYLQTFKGPADPDDPDSTLVDVLRGRVVLGQAANGLRVALGPFITSVLEYAGVEAGTIEAAVTVPFEDATDLSCAEVIARMLRWLPNSVLWFDYSSGEPVCNLRARASVTPVTLTLGAGATWQEPLILKPRYDLKVDRVALFYVATNRANDASWEVVTPRVYPPGTTGEEPGALVRTIELAGAVQNSTYLKQQVTTAEIPAALDLAGPILPSGGTAADFAVLKEWWEEHRPELKKLGVTLVGFRSGSRKLANGGGTVTPGLRELTGGGLASWMSEGGVAVTQEEQLVEVDVAYDLAPNGDTAKKQRVLDRLTAQIVATNAQTKTYSQLQDASGSPAEEIPEGLESALHAALNPLQWEGQIQLVEQEASAWPGPGTVVNIAGGKAAWATMAAVVQARVVDLEAGRTTITLGPPTDLSAAGLVEIYRTNRNRRPSTSYLVRSTGKTGGGALIAAPLPVAQPIRPAQSSTRQAPRIYNRDMTVAGVVPTPAEITTALEAVWTGTDSPVSGDVVNLLVSTVPKLRATVVGHATASGLFCVAFVVGGVTFYALVVQTGDF